MKRKEKEIKIGDWLKMVELRRKLEPDETSHADLWRKLESIRRQLLKNGVPQARRRTGGDSGKPRNGKSAES